MSFYTFSAQRDFTLNNFRFFCFPDIVLDMASIFEEHHLCPSSRLLSSEQFKEAKGIYVLDENKFIFNKVLVRGTVRARFKLTNSSKVPCVLSMAIKYGAKVRRVNVYMSFTHT